MNHESSSSLLISSQDIISYYGDHLHKTRNDPKMGKNKSKKQQGGGAVKGGKKSFKQTLSQFHENNELRAQKKKEKREE